MTESAFWLRIFLLLACALSTPVRAGAAQSCDPGAVAAAFHDDVYILSGGFGIFSTGMDKLRSQLKHNGVTASLVSYQSWRSVAQKIINHRNKYGRKPVVLIGHSLGANNAILVANTVKKKGIQVDLIVSFAATAQLIVPSNVRNVVNFYFKSGGWAGVFKGENDFAGTLTNMDMTTQPGMTHFNLDDSPALHDEVVRQVLRYIRPAKPAMAVQ